MKFFTDLANDQDFQQKLGTSTTVALELYKVIVSSLLILFIPQKCGDHVCSFNENLATEDSTYTGGLVINFLTLCSFAAMYAAEIKRENKLITYLEVNKSKASDNESVGKALELLPADKRNSILSLDRIYQKLGVAAITMFIINTVLSGVVVYKYYLDSQTTTTYVTNILFMTTKMADVYANVNTEQNVFYSAYLKAKVQYNDVDPNKRIEDVGMTIENIKSCEKMLNLPSNNDENDENDNNNDNIELVEDKIKVILHSDSEDTLSNKGESDLKKTQSMGELGYVV